MICFIGISKSLKNTKIMMKNYIEINLAKEELDKFSAEELIKIC
tara:strand:- start:37 stop:168 length:132 start_codon:yes stop_codon:yes gene_type:complete